MIEKLMLSDNANAMRMALFNDLVWEKHFYKKENLQETCDDLQDVVELFKQLAKATAGLPDSDPKKVMSWKNNGIKAQERLIEVLFRLLEDADD